MVAQTSGTTASRRLTLRMVEALADMQAGATVECEPFFSWPSWSAPPNSSRRCPSCSMLEGLNARGLLDIVKGNRWTIRINDEGVQALSVERQSAAERRSPFRRMQMSYARADTPSQRCGEVVTARTEKEARSKLLRALKRRAPHYEYVDVRVENGGSEG